MKNLMVAKELGVAAEYLRPLEVAALLHDIGRVGLEPGLFGIGYRVLHVRLQLLTFLVTLHSCHTTTIAGRWRSARPSRASG